MAKGAKSASAKSDMSSPVKGGGGPVHKYKPTPSPKKKDERCKPIQMVQLMVGHFTISMMPRKRSKASLTEMACSPLLEGKNSGHSRILLQSGLMTQSIVGIFGSYVLM